MVEYLIPIDHIFVKQARALLLNKFPTQEEGATEPEAPGDAEAEVTTAVYYQPFLFLVTMCQECNVVAHYEILNFILVPSENSSMLYREQCLARIFDLL